jgi:hypothetical protein
MLDKNLKRAKSQRLKQPIVAKLLELSKESHKSYRQLADLMNDQRPLLRELRTNANASMNYDGSNNCRFVMKDAKKYDWKEITQTANTYVFESLILKESRVDNPYAKELYGKEVKKDDTTDNEQNIQ